MNLNTLRSDIDEHRREAAAKYAAWQRAERNQVAAHGLPVAHAIRPHWRGSLVPSHAFLTMSLLNYSTKVSATKTVGEIQEMLRKAGALRVLTEYGPVRGIWAISLQVSANGRLISFRMAPNFEKALRVLKKANITSRLKCEEHAEKVAWRIEREWVAVELARIEMGNAELCQAFLPYAQNERGETVFQQLQRTGFHGLALPPSTAA